MKPKYKLVLTFIFFVSFISAVGLGFDRMLLQEGVPRTGVLSLSNLLTGLVAGFLFLQYKIRAQE